jgi:hypothetical protein
MDSFYIFVYTIVIHGFFHKVLYFKKYPKMVNINLVNLDMSSWLGNQFGPSCCFDWQSDKLFN